MPSAMTSSQSEIASTPTVLVLDLAERISTLVEAEIWTREHFPTTAVMMVRLRTSARTMVKVMALLQARGIVARAVVARGEGTVGGNLRWLPVDGSVPAGRSRSAQIAELIAQNIRNGSWAGSTFPTVDQISAKYSSSPMTVSAALRIAAAQGLVHKIVVTAPPPAQRRQLCWRPVADPEPDPGDVTGRIRNAVAKGEFGDRLPPVTRLAADYRVGPNRVGRAYRQLALEGLIVRIWPRRGNRAAWMAVPGPPLRSQPAKPNATKPELLAEDITRRLCEWRWIGLDGRPYRRPFPSTTSLAEQYGVQRTPTMKAALELLVARGVLQRVPRVHGGAAYALTELLPP
jgi:DNA-binding GntR family transcriptional regulator